MEQPADLEDQAGSCASGAQHAFLESSSLESERAPRRAHKAARTSCAEEVVVHYGPRAVGPGCRLGGQGRLLRIRSPRRQLGDFSLESDRASWRAHETARTSRAEEVVVHYGPPTGRAGPPHTSGAQDAFFESSSLESDSTAR